MKCAGAVISSASVRCVRLSIEAVYHAGTLGSTNEMRHTGRSATVPLPSTIAVAGAAPQVAVGCRSGTWGDSTQRRLPGSRSQRLSPTMIARDPS